MLKSTTLGKAANITTIKLSAQEKLFLHNEFATHKVHCMEVNNVSLITKAVKYFINTHFVGSSTSQQLYPLEHLSRFFTII